ncbi:uncharacterized protein si:dkey-250k15.4 [Thalassophryne amazonica]|uniref:uncharacterized protein si:dkey-250k15.4 n=1 Tax=Thalassophryne amazonica TaxID=390379 RepID=UPI001471382E|nr:uncharacterized protein si:dkey-250k15.4 [Thalassophryne amazonica]
MRPSHSRTDKEKDLSVFNKQLKTRRKKCCQVSAFMTDSTCFNSCQKTHGQHKMKRLKTHKQRNQMRGGKKESQHLHHCHGQSSRDMAHFHSCCHISCHCPPRRVAPFSRVVPPTQEPSIITDSRLIGHHGLFNHEVKSVDIARLLSQQKKQENSRPQLQSKSIAALFPSSASHAPSPLFSNNMLSADSNENLADSKTQEVCVEKDLTTFQPHSQGSGVTPEQRTQLYVDLSSDSEKGIFSTKHSPSSGDKTSKKTESKVTDSQPAPAGNRDKMSVEGKSTEKAQKKCDNTPQNREPCDPSLLQFCSSATAAASDSHDTEHTGQDHEGISNSISAVAAQLCCCLNFPCLKQRHVLAESREVLLQALQDRHGSQLQENLLKVQQHFSFDCDPGNPVQAQNREALSSDEDGLWSTNSDVVTTAFQANAASQSCFHKQKMASSKRRNRYVSWRASPQPIQSPDKIAEWLKGPCVESFTCLSNNIPMPHSSQQFSMDFEPHGPSSSDDLFAPSSSAFWTDKASRAQSRESNLMNFSESNFINQTTWLRERSRDPPYYNSSSRLFLHSGSGLEDLDSVEPRHYTRKKDPFKTATCISASSSFGRLHHSEDSNHFHHSTQVSQPPTCSSIRSHHIDMTNYPPSHMLERDSAPLFSSFSSPQHWSFPPMKLY